MFVSDKFIYLQMQKTACTHITRTLSSHFNGKEYRKHSPLTFDPMGRIIIGSVRNPWDWYVSLWAFGCLSKGAFYRQVVHSNKSARTFGRSLVAASPRPLDIAAIFYHWLQRSGSSAAIWRHFYADANDPSLFRGWLKYCLGVGKNDLVGGYRESALSEFAGLMTYRFVSLYCDHRKWRKRGRYIHAYDDLEAFFDEFGIIEKILFMENLTNDLTRTLTELGANLDSDAFANQKKTNTSQHRSFEHYYDESTASLVGQQEKFIVRRYGYRPPTLP